MNRIFALLLSLALIAPAAVGCCSGNRVDLRPTVDELVKTIELVRTRDYETGRVRFTEEPKGQELLEKESILMLKDAERNGKKALELANK